MIHFYTAIYGDHIAPQEFDTGGFEFRCYTNRPIPPTTWRTVTSDRMHDDPRLAAKWWKLFPPTTTAASIWIDASIRVTNPKAMVDACVAAIANADVALFLHPDRTNIYDEAEASLAMPNKYAGLPLREQVESYRAAGLPDDHKLWAGGVIVRKHTAKRPNFEADWWAEILKWSYQDQLSLPYVLWKHGVTPGVIPGSVYGTAFHTWHPTADPPKAAVRPAPPVAVPLQELRERMRAESRPTERVKATKAPPTVIDLPSPPRVSVVTPTHSTKWLGDCWRSLREQTYNNFEWLISVNSKTGRRAAVQQLAGEVATAFGDDPRVRIVQDLSPFSHVGQRKAFAFGAATGDIVVEFDHDDILVPDALSEIAAAFADPAVGFVYSDFADFHEGAGDLQGNLTYRAPDLRPGWIRSGFTFYDADVAGIRPGRYDCVQAPAATALAVSHIYTAPNHVRAWRRSVYEKIGGHNPDLAVADDHELIVRTYLETTFHHIHKPLYLYRITGENTWAGNIDKIKTTSDQIQNDYLERLVLRECELLGLPAVELGGGIDPRPGWTACDLQDAPIIADLRERWPFADGSVGAFRASDILEHLPDKLHTMSEIHRCLRPGGWLLSMTPSAEGIGAFMDPTHASYWVAPSFWYYTRPTSARYIRNTTMLFREVHLETVTINVQGVNVPYVRANLVRL